MTAGEREPLALTPAEPILRAELEALPEAALGWRPAPAEWCILEPVGHLIEAEERGFAGHVRQILAEDDPLFTLWDQPAVARQRHDCERDPATHLAEFAVRREASVALVASSQPSELLRSGRHPVVGRLSIGDLLQEWVFHDRNHLRQILANVQAFVWPHMGNAQRFSRP